MLGTLKGGLRKLFIDIPIGLLFWISGALQYAGWYIPAKLGVDFAQEVTTESKKSMKKGRERAF